MQHPLLSENRAGFLNKHSYRDVVFGNEVQRNTTPIKEKNPTRVAPSRVFSSSILVMLKA